MFSKRLLDIKKFDIEKPKENTREDNLARARVKSVPRRIPSEVKRIPIIDFDLDILTNLPKIAISGSNKSLGDILLEECQKVDDLASLLNFQKVTSPLLENNKTELREAWNIVQMYLIVMCQAVNNEFDLQVKYQVQSVTHSTYDEYFNHLQETYFSLEDQIIEQEELYNSDLPFNQLIEKLADIFADFSTSIVEEVE